ncbi:MAG: hypothetical protein ACX936_04180 [Marinobacter sp.]
MGHFLSVCFCLILALPLSAVADSLDTHLEHVETDDVMTHFSTKADLLLAQAGYGRSFGRSAAQSDYQERVKAALTQMDEKLESSALAAESEQAASALEAGLVYRNPEFWSNVGDPNARRIFDGEQISLMTGIRLFTGWLAADATYCSPFDEASREIDWPDGPAIRQILADDAEAAAFPENPVLHVRESHAELFSVITQPALLTENIVAQSRQSPAMKERMVGTERDAARMMRLSGCNSATGKQFEENLIRLLRGTESLQAAGIRLEHIERESDAPPN